MPIAFNPVPIERIVSMSKMKRALPLILLLSCLVILLPGCRNGVPIQDFSSPMPLVEKEPDKTIAAAIIRAGARTGWEITPIRPGVMSGSLVVRGKHTAMVEITYNKNEYSIKYKNSVNLEHRSDGRIHPNYNKWVSTLNNNIRHELAGLAL